MATSVARIEQDSRALRPVLVRYDDHSQIALEVERDEDRVVVFLPGVPSPWSGSTAVFEASRVSCLDDPSLDAIKVFSRLGRGSLAGIDRAADAPAETAALKTP